MRVLCAVAVLLITGTAHAYDAPCRALYRGVDVPRKFEVSYFLSAGFGTRAPLWGLGFEMSIPALHWRGFPSGYGHDRSELRYGTWFFGGTRVNGGVIEGGSMVDVSSRYHASWGTFTLRVGAGYGAFRDERDGYGVVTLAYGVRSVLARFSHEGACRRGSPVQPLPEASVARIFATHRRAFMHDGYEWTFGIELSPTFFWPPLTWWRVAGGPPR